MELKIGRCWTYCGSFLWFILQGGHTMDRPVKLVSPSWIWKCITKGHLVPENKFAL